MYNTTTRDGGAKENWEWQTNPSKFWTVICTIINTIIFTRLKTKHPKTLYIVSKVPLVDMWASNSEIGFFAF